MQGVDLFPTIFALWRAPSLLPRIYVKHPYVTRFLVNGVSSPSFPPFP